MWFRHEPHYLPHCGHMWKIRSGPDRNLETSWAISALERRTLHDLDSGEMFKITFNENHTNTSQVPAVSDMFKSIMSLGCFKQK